MSNQKLSSYQKLKMRIEQLEDELHDVKLAIVRDDILALSEIKMIYGTELKIQEMVWFGDPTSEDVVGESQGFILTKPRKHSESFIDKVKRFTDEEQLRQFRELTKASQEDQLQHEGYVRVVTTAIRDGENFEEGTRIYNADTMMTEVLKGGIWQPLYNVKPSDIGDIRQWKPPADLMYPKYKYPESKTEEE